ncbi:Spermidine/putrescine transport system permease protein PotB [subsurface metagenome]
MEVTELVENKRKGIGIWVKKFLAAQVHLPYVGPISIWIILFVFAPLIVVLYFSFLSVGPALQIIKSFTLEHYKAIFKTEYGLIFLRTILYAFETNVISLLLGYPMAYWIAKYGGRWKTVLIFFVILPSWTCYLIRLYALKSIIGRAGLINSLLLSLNIISSPLDILYTPFAVVIGLVYTWIPFMILPVYASIEGLNPSILEASLDLGATPFKRFLTVTLPLTKGGVIAGTILVFIPSLGEWLVPMLLGGAKVMMAGNLVSLYFVTAGNIPAGCSIAAALTAIVVLMIYLFIKFGGEEALERIV